MPAYEYIFGDDAIHNVRQQFEEHYNRDFKEEYDDKDVEVVMTNDWWMKRFINHNYGNETEAVAQLIQCLKWRKLHNIRGLDPNYFPQELHKLGAVFEYGPDRNGFITLWIRLRYVRRSSEIQELMRKFLLHHINKVDDKANGKGWVIVVDFGGAGLQNADIDLAKLLIHSLQTYFPSGIVYVLCVDFHFILRAFWNVIKSLIPNERRGMIRMTTKSRIKEFIDEDNLPDFMNGTSKRAYSGSIIVPDGSPNFVDFCHFELGLSYKVSESVYATYKPYFKSQHVI